MAVHLCLIILLLRTSVIGVNLNSLEMVHCINGVCTVKCISLLRIMSVLADSEDPDGMPYLELDARKPVFGGLRTTKAQTSLRIRAD